MVEKKHTTRKLVDKERRKLWWIYLEKHEEERQVAVVRGSEETEEKRSLKGRLRRKRRLVLRGKVFRWEKMKSNVDHLRELKATVELREEATKIFEDEFLDMTGSLIELRGFTSHDRLLPTFSNLEIFV